MDAPENSLNPPAKSLSPKTECRPTELPTPPPPPKSTYTTLSIDESVSIEGHHFHLKYSKEDVRKIPNYKQLTNT